MSRQLLKQYCELALADLQGGGEMWPNKVMKGIRVRAQERNQKEAAFRASMYQKNETRKDKRRDCE